MFYVQSSMLAPSNNIERRTLNFEPSILNLEHMMHRRCDYEELTEKFSFRYLASIINSRS